MVEPLLTVNATYAPHLDSDNVKLDLAVDAMHAVEVGVLFGGDLETLVMQRDFLMKLVDSLCVVDVISHCLFR